MPRWYRNSGSNKRVPILCAAVAALALVSAVVLRAEHTRTHRSLVWDEAALLGSQEHERIAAYHRRLREGFDIDYRVLTHRNSGDVDGFSHVAFEERRVGSLSDTGRGLLLLIDPDADQVRLEVAAALEGVFTDAFVAYLEHRQMVPFFASGRIAEGVLATTELIVARAQEAVRGRAFDPVAAESFSLGGGARAAARIGQGAGEAPTGATVAGQRSPALTVAAYLATMRARNGRWDLDLYTPETRELLRDWTMTPAQMDQVVRVYERCPSAEVRRQGARAVVRYPAEARRCAPWFLEREDGRWRLDFAGTQRRIRFNHENFWRFEPAPPDADRFAFEDWRFDQHGFPHAGP